MFKHIAQLSDISEGQLLAVTLDDGQRICLALSDGQVYAVDDRCTHADYPLSDGSLNNGCEIECALHGAAFDLRDGSVLEAPAMEALRTYPVRVEDGGVWVELD